MLEGFTTKVAQLQVGESVSYIVHLFRLFKGDLNDFNALTTDDSIQTNVSHCTHLLPSEISDARQQKYDSFHTWVGQVQGWSWE